MSQELLITAPDRTTQRITLESDVLLLGRSHGNDLCFPDDASLSRKHLKLTVDAEGCWAEDLGSKNGTLLNGARLTSRTRIAPGDRLSVGQLTVSLLGDDGEEAAASEVFFTPDAGEGMAPSATVMTSLEGLFSGESTRPELPLPGALRPGGFVKGPRPGTPPGAPAAPAASAASRAVFESPVVRVLFRATRELVGHRPLEELFPLILELSIEAVGAERGVLMAYENGRLVAKAVHGEGFRISTTVRDRVLVDKSSVLVKDMQQEEAFRLQQSISAQNIHTMMAVPLQTDARVIGLIYVDSRLFVRQFHEDDLNLLTVLANVAAIRIEQERFAKLERENEQAAKIQRGILPSAAPELPGFDVSGHNAPCLTVGGDYYDYLRYDDGRFGLVLGDVAGKGMAAALLMSNLQARVQILAEQPGELCNFMSRLDKSISSQCPPNRFITFFFGVVDPATGALDYCNAGHNPPLLVRAGGTVETLQTSGTVLGMLPESGYTQQAAQLEPGDLLAIFSDGVTEASGHSQEEFGESRLAEVLLAHREETAAAIVDAVLARVAEWTGPAPAEDDVTLVVLRRTA